MAETQSFIVTTVPKNLKDADPNGLELTNDTLYSVTNDSANPVRFAEAIAVPDRDTAGVHTLMPYMSGRIKPDAATGIYVWTKSGRSIIAVTEAP